jgi:integrase
MARPIRPHWHKGRSRWYANIGERDEKGRRREVYAPTTLGPRDITRAWDWMREEQQRRERAEDPQPETTALTVDGLCQLYLVWAEERRDSGQLSPGHYENKQLHLRRFHDVFGQRRANTISGADIESFIASLQREGLAVNYVRNLIANVSAAFNWAAKPRAAGADRLLSVNPFKGAFSRPVAPAGPERFAERDEAAVWLRHIWRRSKPGSVANRYDRLMALLQRVMTRSGARPGELVALVWSDIKWRGWTTTSGHVGAKATLPADRWKSGKTTGGQRTIYLSPTLTRALHREYKRPDRNPLHVFTHAHGRGGKGAGEPWLDSSVLSKRTLVIRRELIARQEEIRKKTKTGKDVTDQEQRLARVVIKDEGPNRMSNYRWRHTAISTLLMQGVDVATAAGLTGTSIAMIEKTYGHLLDKHLQGAAERLANGRK